jgi:hypothetical protein
VGVANDFMRGCSFPGRRTSPFRLSIQAFDLICRKYLYLGLSLAKADRAGDADGSPLDHGESLIACYRGPGCNESGELLVGIFSSEIDKCGPQRAGCYRHNPTDYLDLFTDIITGIRVFYQYQLVRTRHNRTQKQSENRE